MMQVPRLLVLLLVGSLLGCAYLTFLCIDRSISLTYLTQAYESERSSVENLQALIAAEWKEMPEALLHKKLEDAAAQMPNRGIVVKKEGDVIWFDQLAFNFKHGKLDSVGATVR